MGYEVFISFKRNALDGSGKTRDYEIASDLHKALKDAGVEAFISEKDLFTYDFRRKIDDALDESKILIAVGTSRDNMESENVRYEWTSFHNDILSRIKPDAQIFSYIEGMNHTDLPRALRHYESLTTNEKTRLVEMVMKILGETTPYHNLQVGGKVIFGQYPQGAKGEVQPLEWRVLAVDNGRALLITEKLIDYVPYNIGSSLDVTWETCSLRKWMNEDFIVQAFSSNQQTQIVTIANQNTNHMTKRSDSSNITLDKIFALSIDEAKKYFRDNIDRMAVVTEYVKKHYLRNRVNILHPNDDVIAGDWWLRSPSLDSVFAEDIRITDDHIYDDIDFTLSCPGCVRPAFWLDLS